MLSLELGLRVLASGASTLTHMSPLARISVWLAAVLLKSAAVLSANTIAPSYGLGAQASGDQAKIGIGNAGVAAAADAGADSKHGR